MQPLPQYVLEGPKWASNTVSWSFEASTYANNAAFAFSNPIGPAYQDTVRQAFTRWASVSGLAFKETPDAASYQQSADIRIGFGKLGTATTGTIGATSYGYTGVTLIRDVIVQLEDPSESAVVRTGTGYVYQSYGTTLFQLALHEIGHALGLDHNSDPASVMNPTPGAGDQDLDANDIAAIQALYGAPAGAPTPAPTLTPAPTPTPTPTLTPAPAPAPSGTDTLVLHLSEDAYLGDAQFTVAVDGKSLGAAQSVTALHGAGRTQDFTFTGAFGAGPHQVGVSFVNDAWGGTASTDRNLYVDGASLNGTAVSGATATLLSNGTSTFTATGGTSTPAPTPITTSTLVLHLSEDAYLGDAQFVASVDGNALGAAQSVTALHGLGKLQDFTFTGVSGGSFGAGPHDLAIAFTNDAWGGTPDTDRNLYVGGVDLNGAHLANATGTLFSNGAGHVAFNI